VTSLVVAVLTLATLIRSSFGFGEALIAVPLLALIIPVEVAAPTAALVSITVAIVAVVQDWSEIDRPAAIRLVVSTVAGIPLGLLMLTRAPEAFVKGALGLVIIGFALFSLVRQRAGASPALTASAHGATASPAEPPGRRQASFAVTEAGPARDRLAWLFGFAGGVLGGAYGMNGPPLAIYGVLRGWSPKQFRATLQGYFLPASTLGMFGYWTAGLWTAGVTHYFLTALPTVAAAIVAGRMMNRRMESQRFFRYIYVGLIIVGAVLLAGTNSGVSRK
jgi:uncharacterized membrane protein YfcA